MWVIAIKNTAGQQVAKVRFNNYDEVNDFFQANLLPGGWTTETLEEGED